jgi:hypothetical protein
MVMDALVDAGVWPKHDKKTTRCRWIVPSGSRSLGPNG